MPTAGPHTTATAGLLNCAMPRRKRNTGESCVAGGLFRKSPMSLPALKVVSLPWNSTQRTAGSASAASSASASAAYIAAVMEFFLSGRLKVSVVTPASVWTRMSLMGLCWVGLRPCAEKGAKLTRLPRGVWRGVPNRGQAPTLRRSSRKSRPTMLSTRPLAVLCLSLALLVGTWPAPAAAADTSPTTAPARPRVGLVLSGGGARGLSHVGVLKVLEAARVPVDLIVGTAMGAIVGGLYASGMRAAELERELKAVRWDEVFTSRVARQQLSQRRKEEDFEISPLIELGWRDGALQAPRSAVSSRGLESLLRRYTLPVRDIERFDRLPIPFRAIATDMESGAAVVLEQGDLALALRSSMSVPGVFSPTELNGRVLGDGGLVNNLPIDVARALGADVVIAVNIGTPPGGRETLPSAGGGSGQTIKHLTEQNVQRSLATLKPADVLIAPPLGVL